MKKIKISKKLIKIVVIVIIGLSVLNIAISGINIVPSKFRNVPVSFLTPDLDWCSRPSDVILKYGLPEDVRMLDSATGENDFTYNFTYGDKQVEVFASNRYLPNSCFFNYCFYVDCKTPEEAEKFFNESHKRMLEFYGDEEGFSLEDETGSMKKEYIIWSGATGIVFEMSYSEDDSVVFIKSHCQY